MEKKINIAELLKDCPKGMELDCTLYEDVYFDGITEHISFPIAVNVKCDDEIWTKHIILTNEGKFGNHPNAKCIIFPKGKTTWEGFQRPFKDGDIVTWKDRGSLVAFIYKERKDVAVVKHHFALYTGSLGIVTTGEISLVESEIVFATEEEKQKLFDAIKANGYKWNAETKTLEKLIQPKFKVGDKIKKKGLDNTYAIEIATVGDTIYTFKNSVFQYIEATDKNYELVPNKFDITTLKPFESKVLVRHSSDNKWCGSFFSHIDVNLHSHCFKYVTIAGKSYPMCIPYEENKHLLGTTNDCDEFYKIWI